MGGPSFRSFIPTSNTTRYLPKLQALANNGPFTWEVLPYLSRSMSFRVTARLSPGVACNSYKDMSLQVDGQAGPFKITYPDIPNVQWRGNTLQPISWNPARTNVGPINATHVDIFLSRDSGLSFPTPLESNVPNNGYKEICVPNFNSSNTRILVKAAGYGSFFNVTHFNLTTVAVPPAPPQLGQAARNPMRNTEARIKLINCISATNEIYTVNGLSGATVRLDRAINQFIIEHISTPRKASVTITATDNFGVSRTSNAVIIPSIL